ncbi:MAG: hypothetical protein ACYTFU_08840 [Planctomycetota bacterium]|jgi:hypothetical protein
MARESSPEAELQPEDIVGDRRKLMLYSVSPGTGDDSAAVGDVWQADDGQLHGTGMAAVMLFEPLSAARYQMVSVGADMSPLAVFYARICRSPFIRAEVVDD